MMATTSIQEEPPRRRFQPPDLPANEEARLAALRSLHILDTSPSEERFDSITREVQQAFDVPFVFISLVDQNRQWFKSTQWSCPIPPGGTPRETPRDISFCGHCVCGGSHQIMVVPDALLDDRFADNPLVTGPPLRIRFYAGCPLNVGREDSGDEPLHIGTLCMIDSKPLRNADGPPAEAVPRPGQPGEARDPERVRPRVWIRPVVKRAIFNLKKRIHLAIIL